MRWNDGRSGESGRFAGNLVLDHLDPGGNQISKHKGTVFIDDRRCFIGRVVADDVYLSVGVLHWANISADQHREFVQFATETRRDLFYLFITAHPGSQTVQFWKVPASVLDRELRRRGKDERGSVFGLHISERAGKHMLGEEDVIAHYAEFNVAPESSAALTSAVRRDRAKKDRSSDGDPATGATSDLANLAVNGGEMRRFEIPLSGGRVATLDAPVPMTPQDLIRVKGYIDLMSDLLVT